MSGIEIASIVLGILGPIEQSATNVKRLRDHFKSFRQNETTIQHLLTSLSDLQHDLRQLQSQLNHHQPVLPQHNINMFQTQLMKITNMFTDMNSSLQKMEQSASRNFKHFLKASKWNEHCDVIQKQLHETRTDLLLINSFLGVNAVVSFSTEQIPQMNDTMKQIESKVDQALAAAKPIDTFRIWQQQLHVSRAVIPSFDSVDCDGNPLSTEGKIRRELLNSEESYDKVFSIQGPSGVGKTTILHMLSRDQQVRQHFHQGLYFLKLGADAKTENTIAQFCKVLRKSGCENKSSGMEHSRNIGEVIQVTSEWLNGKRYLLLVDDVWEQKSRTELGSSLISGLKTMIAESNGAAMVFTTRDTSIAGLGEIFLLDPRQRQEPESRRILFQHARQNYQIQYDKETEEAIAKLLESCAGLPVAHSAMGKSVWQYSLTRKLTGAVGWRMYLRRHESLLDRTADGYECLSSIFRHALNVLEEDERYDSKNTSDTTFQSSQVEYCYREMHRSLCVLEKQEWIPMKTLGYMWNIQEENEIREVCENLVRVGLAEWHHEEVTSDQDIEGISIHDLLHEFAVKEARRHNEITFWHMRLIEGSANRVIGTERSGDTIQEGWTSERKDRGDLMSHLATLEGCEVVRLLPRSECIKTQMPKNISLQHTTNPYVKAFAMIIPGRKVPEKSEEAGSLSRSFMKHVLTSHPTEENDLPQSSYYFALQLFYVLVHAINCMRGEME